MEVACCLTNTSTSICLQTHHAPTFLLALLAWAFILCDWLSQRAHGGGKISGKRWYGCVKHGLVGAFTSASSTRYVSYWLLVTVALPTSAVWPSCHPHNSDYECGQSWAYSGKCIQTCLSSHTHKKHASIQINTQIFIYWYQCKFLYCIHGFAFQGFDPSVESEQKRVHAWAICRLLPCNHQCHWPGEQLCTSLWIHLSPLCHRACAMLSTTKR